MLDNIGIPLKNLLIQNKTITYIQQFFSFVKNAFDEMQHPLKKKSRLLKKFINNNSDFSLILGNKGTEFSSKSNIKTIVIIKIIALIITNNICILS